METGGVMHKRGKDLYDTVRLLVENSLDSAESISQPPKIVIAIEEISESNSKVHADDNETTKKRKRKLMMTENAPSGSQVKGQSAAQGMKVREEVSCYRVRCQDNGKGMSRAQIEMLAADAGCTNLASIQTRGQFDRDLKLLVRRSRIQFIEIVSSMTGEYHETHGKLSLADGKLVVAVEEKDKMKDWHGATIAVDVEGDWATYKNKILQFIEEIAWITPFSDFQFTAKASDGELSLNAAGVPAEIEDPLQDLTPAGYPYFINRIGKLDPESYSATSEVSGQKTAENSKFIVEAAVILGVNEVGQQGPKIYRFANRVPLLFEEIEDVVTQTVNKFDWNTYKISTNYKICVLVSIVSTKIPFKEPCKEYIEDDKNIAAAVKLAIEECCTKLRSEKEEDEWLKDCTWERVEMMRAYLYRSLGVEKDVHPLADKLTGSSESCSQA